MIPKKIHLMLGWGYFRVCDWWAVKAQNEWFSSPGLRGHIAKPEKGVTSLLIMSL